MLTFYDIDNTANTLKTKLAIAIKGLDKDHYERKWVHLPDIQELLQSKGVPAVAGPSLFKYTLPAIEHDGKVIMDSFAIALYLEETFPNTPSLFPNQSIPFCRMLQEQLFKGVTIPLVPFILPKMVALMNDKDAKYLQETREPIFGPSNDAIWENKERVAKAMEAITPTLKLLDQVLKDYPDGPYVFGKQRSYADCIILAWLGSLKARGEDYLFARIIEIAPELQKLYETSSDILN